MSSVEHLSNVDYVFLQPPSKKHWIPLQYLSKGDSGETFQNGLKDQRWDAESSKELLEKKNCLKLEKSVEAQDYQTTWLTPLGEIYIASNNQDIPPTKDPHLTLVTKLTEEQVEMLNEMFPHYNNP